MGAPRFKTLAEKKAWMKMSQAGGSAKVAIPEEEKVIEPAVEEVVEEPIVEKPKRKPRAKKSKAKKSVKKDANSEKGN